MSSSRQDQRSASMQQRPARSATRRRSRQERDRGWFSNYVGGLYLWSGIDYQDQPVFFDLAIRKFSEAAEVLPEAYQPYENLGDARRFKARVLRGEIDVNLLYEAVRDYSTALSRVRSYPGPDDKARTTTRNLVSTRIEVARAIAQVSTGDSDLREEVLATIRSWDWDKIPRSWSAHPDVRVSYNAASLYALVDGALGPYVAYPILGGASAATWAYRHLAYTFVCEPEYARHVDADRDLDPVRQGIDMLKRGVWKLLAQDPELCQRGWRKVRSVIEGAVHQAEAELTKERSVHGNGAH